ncbi:MAG TPA: response regulator, partial [Anaerolineae bacterium]
GAATDAPLPAAPKSAVPALAGNSQAPRLLLALSPDPNAADLLAGLIQDYRVMATSQPALAREQIVSALPQALIVDDALAGSPDVAALLQNLPYDLPVLALRLPGSGAQVRELPDLVAGYLVKPVQRESLVHALAGLARPPASILVVDDDPAMARFVGLALQAAAGSNGIGPAVQVLSAATGKEALAWLGQNGSAAACPQPDAILLDLRLPDMSGWDVLAALHDAPAGREIPVILVTATNLPEELDSRERKALQISTFRRLSQDELAQALAGLLQAIRPKFAADGGLPGRPADPSG